MEESQDLESLKEKLKGEIRELQELDKYYLHKYHAMSRNAKERAANGLSQATKKPINFDSLDVQNLIKAELYRFAGLYCCHVDANSFVFEFHSAAQSNGEKRYYVQIVDEKEGRKLGFWYMPQGLNLEKILEVYPIVDKRNLRGFLRCVTQNLNCVYQRGYQYRELKEIISEFPNCELSNNSPEVYTRLVLQMIGILDTRTNDTFNIILYINYELDEARPNYVAVDSTKAEPIPESVCKMFRSSFSGFKYLSLKHAFEESLQKLESASFEWKMKFEDEDIEEPPSPTTEGFLDHITRLPTSKKTAKNANENNKGSRHDSSDTGISVQSSLGDGKSEEEPADRSESEIEHEEPPVKPAKTVKKKTVKTVKTAKPRNKKTVGKSKVAESVSTEKCMEVDVNGNNPSVKNVNVPKVAGKRNLKLKKIAEDAEHVVSNALNDVESPKKVKEKRSIRFAGGTKTGGMVHSTPLFGRLDLENHPEPDVSVINKQSAEKISISRNAAASTSSKSRKFKPIDDNEGNPHSDPNDRSPIPSIAQNGLGKPGQRDTFAFSTPYIANPVFPEDPEVSAIPKGSKTINKSKRIKKKKASTPPVSEESETETKQTSKQQRKPLKPKPKSTDQNLPKSKLKSKRAKQAPEAESPPSVHEPEERALPTPEEEVQPISKKRKMSESLPRKLKKKKPSAAPMLTDANVELRTPDLPDIEPKKTSSTRNASKMTNITMRRKMKQAARLS